MKKVLLLSISIILFSITSNAQEKTAIICGKLITAEDNKVYNNTVIIIKADKIVEIGTRDIIKPDYKIIDLSEYTVLPGLIDAHVHPLIYGDDYQVNHLKGSSAFNALRGLKTVQNWLNEGWTSIRVAGDADTQYAHFEIRDAINAGLFDGPRIYGAGHYLSVTGGGGDINFLSPDQSVISDGLVVDGVDEIQKAIREEIIAAVEEAKRRGIPVMAHAHATEGINKAIKFGARSIEHGTFLNDESIDLFLEYDVFLIPTVSVGEYGLETWKDSKAQAKMYELTKKFREDSWKMYSKSIERGVKIGVGSDNVGFPPNFAATEFRLLVKLGMTPLQAIMAGTKVNAELLMKDDEIGSIKVGKLADIIATKENPLDDISELSRVIFVMKGGKVIKAIK
jgi:imidazolonepropionase-like amidohydrolase